MVVIIPQYNVAMIALSTGIAFIGAFAAVSLCEQYRLSTLSQSSTNRFALMIFVALSLGSVGIWAMHYIAMASFTLYLDGVKVPIRYNYTYLIVSLVLVNIMELIGLYCASTDNCFNKSKGEIMEIFIVRTSSELSLTEIKQMGKLQILRIVCTHSLQRIVLGGFIAGGGVALMHYLGMMSMEFQGTITYDPGLVVLSVIVAICAVMGGFWVFFRILSIFPSLDILRIACALNGMFSLSGVHYIGMISAKFEFDPNKAPPSVEDTIDADRLLIGVLAASVTFCAVMQVYVLSDLRGWLLKTSTQLRMADAVIHQLHAQRHVSQQHARAHETGAGCGSGMSTAVAATPTASRCMLKYLRRYGPEASTNSPTSSNQQGVAASTGTASLNASARSNAASTVGLYNDYAEEEDEAASQGSDQVSGGRFKSPSTVFPEAACTLADDIENQRPRNIVLLKPITPISGVEENMAGFPPG